MPATSRAQARLMFAAAAGGVPGIKPSVGKEFTQGFKGHPGSVNQLPPKAPKPEPSGLQNLRSVLHAMRVPKVPG